MTSQAKMASSPSVKRSKSRSAILQRRLSEIILYLGGSYTFDDKVKDMEDRAASSSAAIAMRDVGGSYDNAPSNLSRKQRAHTLGGRLQPALPQVPSRATRITKRSYSLDRRANRPALLSTAYFGRPPRQSPKPSPRPRLTQHVRELLHGVDMDLAEESESDIGDNDDSRRPSSHSIASTNKNIPEQTQVPPLADSKQDEKEEEPIEKQTTTDGGEWTDWLKGILAEKFGGSTSTGADQLQAASLKHEPTNVHVDVSYTPDGKPVDAEVRLQFSDVNTGYDVDGDVMNDSSRTHLGGEDSEDGTAGDGYLMSKETDLLSATVPVHGGTIDGCGAPYEQLKYDNNDELRLDKLCYPPPIFTLLISALQIGMFFTQDNVAIASGREGYFSNSQLVYNPCKRDEAWPRYLMYILAHDDLGHLVSNMVAQVGLGTFMEPVHKWRIPIIYLGSATGGCLLHSVFNGDRMVYGASGGVFGLMGARIVDILIISRRMIFNRSELTRCRSVRQWCRQTFWDRLLKIFIVLFCCSYAIADFVSVLVQYASGDIVTASFGAHFGGLIVGTSLGILVLREDGTHLKQTHSYYMQLQNTIDVEASSTDKKPSKSFTGRLYEIVIKNRLKTVAWCVLALFVFITVVGNILHVTFPTDNSTQCLQVTYRQLDMDDVEDFRDDFVEKKSDLSDRGSQFTSPLSTLSSTSTVRTPTTTTTLASTRAVTMTTPSNRTTADFLLVSDMSAGIIYQLDADTGRSSIVTTGEMRPTAIAYDPKVTKVFWTDVTANTLSSCNLDGSDKKVVYRFPYAPTSDGLAVSAEDQRVYFTNSGGPAIGYVTYDGSHAQTLIRANLSQPRAITLLPHPDYRLMIFSDWGNRQNAALIWRANMDTGTNMQLVVRRGIGWPNGLAVDTITNQIFWCDAATNNIEMADFDGQNRQLLVTVARKHFFGIAVDSQWIYTSSWKDRIVTKHSRHPRTGDLQSLRSHPVSHQMFNQQGAVAISYK